MQAGEGAAWSSRRASDGSPRSCSSPATVATPWRPDCPPGSRMPVSAIPRRRRPVVHGVDPVDPKVGSPQEVVAVGRNTVRIRWLVLAALIGLLLAGGQPVAQAHRTPLRVVILSDQASITPDGRSMSFHIETTCDRQWTIVEASATVTQGGVTSTGSFTPTCGRIPYGVGVTVPASGAAFQTGPAEASVVLVVGQGPNKRAQDSASLRVRPSVSAILDDTASLQGDGSLLIDVTVTCPMSAVGRGEASAVASIEEGGDIISSFDLRTIQIVPA